MSSQTPPDQLPEGLRGYFWEYDASRLSLRKSRHTIIGRLLESGGWDAVCWLRSTIGDAELRDFILRREGRGISPKRLRFWGLVLGIPREQVSRWIQAERERVWLRRTKG
ncbi:MAG: hypothetical protein HY703_11865 [Gemmatimonadetes bacterium]|nr:hypothetical protein [Gemmatimonadota bacterium]